MDLRIANLLLPLSRTSVLRRRGGLPAALAPDAASLVATGFPALDGLPSLSLRFPYVLPFKRHSDALRPDSAHLGRPGGAIANA